MKTMHLEQISLGGRFVPGFALGATAAAYGDTLAAVGLHPDNPDHMYSELMRSISSPVAFKSDQKGWVGARDAKIWWEDPKGTAKLQWPFHWGAWMQNAPESDAQIRAVFKIPQGTDTNDFLRRLYQIPASFTKLRLPKESWEGHNIVSDAVNSAGRDIGKVVTNVGNEVKKIPVVGAPIHDIFDAAYHATAAPFHAITAIAEGKNVGKAALDAINETGHSIKTVAPYAQMVVSMVPGVGQGVSAALSAGMALAAGQPIGKALLAGVAGALPGGPLAQAAFNQAATLVQDAAQHKKIDLGSLASGVAGIAGGAIGLPKSVTDIAKSSIEAGAAIADHKDPFQAVVKAAGEIAGATGVHIQIPDAIKNAVQSGMAMGTAIVHQAERAKQLLGGANSKLVEIGAQFAHSVPAIAEARRLAGGGVRGFDLATGLLKHQVLPFDIHTLRSSLSGADLKGFDTAMALHTGLVAHPVPAHLPPMAQAGHAIAAGSQNLASRQAIMAPVMAHPTAAMGANVAVGRYLPEYRHPPEYRYRPQAGGRRYEPYPT